jgi:menaquinone-dependent protoporphyrinogen oxidase
MPASILVAYASTHGHTGRIAERIGEVLREEGAEVDVRDVKTERDVSPADYDAAVVGASIHAGAHQSELVGWAQSHHAALASMPSAFFSACLTAAEDTHESREATRRYRDEFVERTDWTPATSITFAGALQYREYDFMTRLAMRLMMKRGGHPTDTSHDYDYTDWDAVERFGRDFAASVAGVAPAR